MASALKERRPEFGEQYGIAIIEFLPLLFANFISTAI